ncbi:MAG: hypothetical protein K2P30_14270 [Lachnospiraceae bacterium]|nr:hypothetical protein [Lachnospiraceae bacterium]MDE6964778.1 hypothetical protein [Lachnospiraceae bacterium]
MLLNKNIVFEIIDTNFMDDVTACCEESVLRMDEGELGDYFEEYADKACLNTIYDINVENYEDEEVHGVQRVDGLLEIAALISGYADWGDEAEYIGDAEVILGFAFSFQIDAETSEAGFFEIDWEY